ncbi:MAG: MBL fold metallo-hydrolase [Dehalococcoidia bacterium]|nr:MBL fold metallo-hydrolase [Dehalococcoidia bacterium]
MDTEIRDLAERAWQGERPLDAYRDAGQLFEVGEGIALVTGFGNIVAVRTADGLVLVDTSQPEHVEGMLATLRRWDASPVHTVVYTHGHFDHAGGMAAIDAAAEKRGDARPLVVAHEAVAARFDRYARTAGLQSVINARQFRSRAAHTARPETWQSWRHPDQTYTDRLELTVGGRRFVLHHGKGETDDHTWVELPAEQLVCSGDFFTWVCPNAGNPQKVQRYPEEWAAALRAIVASDAETLVSAHGLPLFGKERIAEALGNAAALLDHLVRETVALMNQGATLDDVLQRVQPPADLAGLHYLAPAYDEPEFIVRNVWRLYGGWYDGNPANLKPPAESAVATELASLAGGAARVADRARTLAAAGDLRLATTLVELAGRASPDDPAVQAIRAEVYAARATRETSLMARSIFRAAAEEAGTGAEGAR